jgi:polyphenol oxidase
MRLVTFFGDAATAIDPDAIREQMATGQQASMIALAPLQDVAYELGLRDLMVLRQVHGRQGTVIISDDYRDVVPLVSEGDFLLTNLPRLGLGVMTADCLPVLLHDVKSNVVGAVHAGWRGAVKGVVPAAIARMQRQFGTSVADLQVSFGPSAHACCYQVDQQFLHQLDDTDSQDEVLSFRDGSYYFDLPLFVASQLYALGLARSALDLVQSVCTICDKRFCSYRRTPDSVMRQISIVALVPDH